ncbi:flagellar hook-length control protein FliK [Pseudomonas cavernae]|uniref:Flagellar hook-length control protein FliK n=1 Tax=Pseudomonas cavernae TaxID=2320867 RepID=A0A385Z3Q8_9PSED|nr:flagellar hook-length control protein FliK [Pseudomonas cavernae]AYC32533.1 flagellar hook-length control protein FliK [Pseudomonas cavernae]
MSVAPDLLLTSKPEVKPKAPVAKAPAHTAEPRKDEASSFAQVYAKERQAKAAEGNDEAAKAKYDKSKEPERADDTTAVVAAGEPPLADSGKPLPTEPAQPDPAMLLAMAGQMPGEDGVLLDVEAEGEEAAALPLSAGTNLMGSGPASLTEASHDPQLDALNEVAGVNLALGLGAKNPAVAQQSAASAGAPPALNSVQGFAAAMAALSDPAKLQGEAKLEAELPLDELSGEGLEGLKDSPSDLRTESFANRLSALSQAIAQQSAPSQRTALVPGQPIPMQQGGWSEAVVDRVMWLSSQNLKSAEIQLDPTELGRLEVRIHMAQDQTQVTFASPNAGVRDALEGQMHRLRDMFAQQGMNLPDVNVSDQSLNRGWQGQGQGESGRGASQFRGGGEHFGADEEVSLSVSEIRSSAGGGGRSLVDYYA